MKIKAVWVSMSLFALSMTLAGGIAFTNDGAVTKEQFISEMDYWYVGHLGQLDDEGRLLAWEGNLGGDVTGELKYWVVQPSPVSGSTYLGGQLVFYRGRWEIWADEELLLAGESAGKIVYAEGADGMYEGHGIVTEASRNFNALKGRKVYETGPVIVGTDPPASFTGRGMFLIH